MLKPAKETMPPRRRPQPSPRHLHIRLLPPLGDLPRTGSADNRRKELAILAVCRITSWYEPLDTAPVSNVVRTVVTKFSVDVIPVADAREVKPTSRSWTSATLSRHFPHSVGTAILEKVFPGQLVSLAPP
jgi:hypothetical protein